MKVDQVPEPIQFYWKRQQLEDCCLWLERQGHPDLARSMRHQTGPKPLLPPEEG